MTTLLARSLLTVPIALILWPGPAGADSPFDDESASLGRVVVTKEFPPDAATASTPGGAAPAAEVKWTERRLQAVCGGAGEVRRALPDCAPCPQADQVRYEVAERQMIGSSPASEWRSVGSTCVALDESAEGVTPARVLSEFRKLEWPQAVVSLQPPGGHTLVNAKTFGFVADPGPVVKSVTLLGESVEVEGTPSSWSWQWGDGEVVETTSPGGPYPDGDVWHVYERAEEVLVAVDVTYTGRFRVNGGAWQELPESHTVSGDPLGLEIHEAIAQLVD